MQKNRTLYLEKTLHYKPNGELIKKILSIGVPNGVENGLFQAGKIILVSLVTSFGTSAITANTVCQTIAGIQVIPGSTMQLAATTVIDLVNTLIDRELHNDGFENSFTENELETLEIYNRYHSPELLDEVIDILKR